MKAPIYNPIARGNPEHAKSYARALKKYLKWQLKNKKSEDHE